MDDAPPVGLRRRVADGLRREAALIGFRWRPLAIVVVATIAILIPLFHRDEPFFRALQSLGGRGLSDGARRFGFDLRFVVRGLAPLVVLLLMRERLADHGLGAGRAKLGLALCAIGWLAYLPCFGLLLASGEFRHFYGFAAHYEGWGAFLRHQVPYLLMAMIPTEILYRGFLLFGLARPYGPFVGMLASIVPYAMSHYTKPEIEALGSIPVGLALSWIALRTGSIWYGVFLHASIAIALNAAVFAFG